MATWWLAIDKNYTSYAELKHRKIIAQGWPDIGNILTLCPLVPKGSRAVFESVIDELEKIFYGSKSHAARVLWDLLNMQVGDIIVGIEGITVKGICELSKNGWESYIHTAPETYNYAQTIGFPVEWVDWDINIFGFSPTPPSKSVQGVAGLQNESQKVIDAWTKYKKANTKP